MTHNIAGHNLGIRQTGGGGGGGGTPGGATTQIQYNDAGAFAGSDRLTYDDSVEPLLTLKASGTQTTEDLLRLETAAGDEILVVSGGATSGSVPFITMGANKHLEVFNGSLRVGGVGSGSGNIWTRDQEGRYLTIGQDINANKSYINHVAANSADGNGLDITSNVQVTMGPTLTLQPTAVADVPLSVELQASHTGNALEVRDSAGTALTNVTPDGELLTQKLFLDTANHGGVTQSVFLENATSSGNNGTPTWNRCARMAWTQDTRYAELWPKTGKFSLMPAGRLGFKSSHALDASSTGGSLDTYLRRESAGVLAVHNSDAVYGTLLASDLSMVERSTDPADPAEGRSIIWQSDGTGSGDDGDIMIKITAGAVTKTVTLVDFSAA